MTYKRYAYNFQSRQSLNHVNIYVLKLEPSSLTKSNAMPSIKHVQRWKEKITYRGRLVFMWFDQCMIATKMGTQSLTGNIHHWSWRHSRSGRSDFGQDEKCVHRTICSRKSTTSEVMAIVIEEETINPKQNLFREGSRLLCLGLHMDPFLHFGFSQESSSSC